MQDRDELERRAMEALESIFDHPSDDRVDVAREKYADDEALLQRVLHLIEAENSTGDILRTGGAQQLLNDELHPDRAGAYKIKSLVGKGGMGAVYTAERDQADFDHNVAVKVIRPGVLSDALVERFERERQILARLNHPNIARLFDGGTLSDGSPYIVMEYVDGAPITDWVKSRGLSKDDRLWLFTDVCYAVQHAHQNLIIHRDITPSNVMVTEDGAVKLIDFGIAKPQVDEDVDASIDKVSLASLSFTPGFAAPERSQGAAPNTLSDIFSLGKLLEAMLADLTASNDIKAIISKATQAGPAERYGAVDALIEDLQNLRSGYAVNARDGGALYRIGKYVSRRRLLVAFGALALTGVIGALAVTLVQYNRAEAALVRANDRFDQARELSRTVIFDVYDDFAKVSGTLEPRQRLADIVDNYVRTLAEDPNAPTDILFDIGAFSNRLSDLYGGLGMANLGDTDKSFELLLIAEEQLNKALEQNPEDIDALAEILMVKRSLVNQSLYYKLDSDAAARYNQDMMRQAEAGILMAGDKERPILRHYWSGRTDRLSVLIEKEDYETALEEVKIWRPELDDAMFERLGGGESMAAYLAAQHGDILSELERYGEAVEPWTFSKNHFEAQLEETPDNYYYKTQLLVATQGLSRAFQNSGNAQEAIENAEYAVQLARDIMAQDEEDAGGPEGLSSALQRLAKSQAFAADLVAAQNTSIEAIGLSRSLTEKFLDDPYYEKLLVYALLSYAEILAMTEAPETSCATALEAQSFYSKLEASDKLTEAYESTVGTELPDLISQNDCVNP